MSLDLLSYLLRTVIVAVAAAVLVGLFRRRSAAVQHAVTASALIAILALLPVSFVVSRELKPAYATVVPIPPIQFLSSPSALHDPERQQEPWSEGARLPATQHSVEVDASSARNRNPGDDVIGPAVRTIVRPTVAWNPLEAVITLWTVVAAVLALRLIGGWVTVARRVSASEPIVLRPNIETRIDHRAAVPLAVWWGRPLVLLPPTWEKWSAERLDTVLDHEVAHLRRGDCWTQFAASLACAVAWMNPLTWWLAGRTRALSEQAVDDVVLAGGIPAAPRQGPHTNRSSDSRVNR